MIHFEFKDEDFNFSDGTRGFYARKANEKVAQFVKDRNWLVDELEATKEKLYLSIEKLRDRNMELETRINSAPTVYSHSGNSWFESGEGIAHHFTAKLVDKKEVPR